MRFQRWNYVFYKEYFHSIACTLSFSQDSIIVSLSSSRSEVWWLILLQCCSCNEAAGVWEMLRVADLPSLNSLPVKLIRHVLLSTMAVMELKLTRKAPSNCVCATKLFILLGERLFFHYLCEEINEQLSFQGYGADCWLGALDRST